MCHECLNKKKTLFDTCGSIMENLYTLASEREVNLIMYRHLYCEQTVMTSATKTFFLTLY
jgi:hypothetical protein